MSGILGQAGDVGMQGLGTVANLVDLVQAGRQGNLGQTLLQRQLALQDPRVRESIGPFLSGALGIYGGQQPTPEVMQAGGPIPGTEILGPGQAPGTPQTQFQANLPPLAEGVQIDQALKRLGLATGLGNLSLQEPRRMLLGAQTRAAEANANWLGQETGGAGDRGNLVMTGYSRTGPTYGQRKTLKLPSGTPAPSGSPYATGDRGPGDENVVVTPPPGAPQPETLEALSKKMDRFERDPEFLAAFPSEAELGQTSARVVGRLQGSFRQYTDSAKVIRMRGEVKQLGFQMARLLGSNSQLSDSERTNALAFWTPIAEGTGTREQLLEAIAGTRELQEALQGGKRLRKMDDEGLPTQEPLSRQGSPLFNLPPGFTVDFH